MTKREFERRVKEVIAEYGFKKSHIISVDDLMKLDGEWAGYYIACRNGLVHNYFAYQLDNEVVVKYQTVMVNKFD